jgi:hypothetical protein
MGLSAEPSRIKLANVYVFGLLALALATLTGWFYLFGFSFSWIALGMSGILAMVSATSRRFPVDLGRATVIVDEVAILVAIVLGGPLWALVVTVPVMLYRDRLRTIFQGSVYAVRVMTAGYVLTLFSKPLLSDIRFDVHLVYGIMGSGLAFCLTDMLVGPGLLRIKYKTPAIELLKEVILPPIPSEVAAIFAALTTSYAAVRFGPGAAITLFSGAALSLGLMSFVRQRQKQFAELRNENRQLKDSNASLLSSNLTFAAALVEKLGRRDGYTALHAQASAVYAEDVAREFRLEQGDIEKLRVAALLQDVGMASLPDEILFSPSERLNSAGRIRLAEHPADGEEVLRRIPEYEKAAKWVRWHHERVDGTGYPDRLRDEWIPLEAKILAAASAYASLVLDKPYGPGLSAQEARRQLIGMSEKALDGLVVRTLLRVLDREGEGYALAADGRFTFLSAGGSSPEKRPTGGLRLVSGEAEAQ